MSRKFSEKEMKVGTYVCCKCFHVGRLLVCRKCHHRICMGCK